MRFIGGSSGRLKEILDVLYEKKSWNEDRDHCISLETIRELTLLETDSRITDLEIIQVQVSRAKNSRRLSSDAGRKSNLHLLFWFYRGGILNGIENTESYDRCGKKRQWKDNHHMCVF